MNGKIISVSIIVLIILVGGWYVLTRKPAGTQPAATETPVATTPAGTATTTPADVVVAYTSQGFSPKSVTVPVGTTVIFENRTADEMWIASAPHPTHQGYDGTTASEHCKSGYRGPVPFDQCTAGNRYSFAFKKAGNWNYHNHTDAADFGTVVVTESASTPAPR